MPSTRRFFFLSLCFWIGLLLLMGNDVSRSHKTVGGPKQLFDKNGQEIAEGMTVRVVKPGLKAYQVPSKAKGTYDGQTFVPDEALPYLVIPVGLQGTVTRVYDTAALSANLPIRVKFEPDDDDDAECKAPVVFVMHFMPAEVEVV